MRRSISVTFAAMAAVVYVAILHLGLGAQGTASNQEACGTNATSESFLQHDIHRETMEVVTDMVEICPGACGCGQYQTEEIVFSCNQSQGTKTFNLAKGAWQTIVNVSKGTNGVSITLNATGDIDLKLYDGSQCVFGFGSECTNSNSTAVDYDGLNITFSGDKTTNPVIESITIEGVTKKILVVKVHAFDEGTGEVAYKHGKIEPCDAQKPVCSKCSDYNKCGAGETPKCDGSTSVKCLAAPTGAPTTAPTTTPTALPTSPPTPPPTSAPTPTPTIAPTQSTCSKHGCEMDPIMRQCWCYYGTNVGGYSACGYASGYSGPYYSIAKYGNTYYPDTALRIIKSLGKRVHGSCPGSDKKCAPNGLMNACMVYSAVDVQCLGTSMSTTFTDQQRWNVPRSGQGGIVRCTNYE